MSPVTSALIDYWHRLPSDSVATRLRRMQSLAAKVDGGAGAPAALVACALGDVDASVVLAATTACIPRTSFPAARRAALEDACEWIRRGLALNRGAVFAAVVQSGDGEALARLARLRLTLTTTEIETLCALLRDRPLPRRTRRFFEEWLGALAADGDPQAVSQRGRLIGLVTASENRSRDAA